MTPSSETNSQAPTLLILILLLRSRMLATKPRHGRFARIRASRSGYVQTFRVSTEASKPSQEMVDASVRPEIGRKPAITRGRPPPGQPASRHTGNHRRSARLSGQSAHENPCRTDSLIVQYMPATDHRSARK